MNSVCTKQWKDFIIGGKNGLFEVTRPNARSSQTYNEGNMPYIASGCFNNGVCGYFEPKDKDDFDKGNCITVSPVDGYAFYQKDDFIGRGGAGSSIIILRRENLNEYIGKFICTIIRKTCKDWSYSNMGNKDRLKDTVIKLPTTSKGEPDWEYMESYMKNIMHKSEQNIENLQNISELKKCIQTQEWSNFNCSELFVAKNTGNILARDVEDGSGDTPYVTASGINNGVLAHIDASKYDIIEGHCILIGGKTFTVTYQADDFVSNDSHNFVIRTNGFNISDLSYKYLVTVIRFYFGQKYSWNDAVTKDKFLSESIPLPMNSKGKPDWEYMENYMKTIMKDTEAKLNKLSCC